MLLLLLLLLLMLISSSMLEIVCDDERVSIIMEFLVEVVKVEQYENRKKIIKKFKIK